MVTFDAPCRRNIVRGDEINFDSITALNTLEVLVHKVSRISTFIALFIASSVEEGSRSRAWRAKSARLLPDTLSQTLTVDVVDLRLTAGDALTVLIKLHVRVLDALRADSYIVLQF